MKTNLGKSGMRFMRYLLIVGSLFIGSSAFADNLLTVRMIGAGGTNNTVTSNGAISCVGGTGSDCSESLPTGTPVTLTAYPDANSIFVGWQAVNFHCRTTAPTCTFQIDAFERIETAVFAPANNLSVTISDPASLPDNRVESNVPGIDCFQGHGDCDENYGLDNVVILTATPDPSAHPSPLFTGWNVIVDDGNDATNQCDAVSPPLDTCTVTIPGTPGKNVTVMAMFNSYILTVDETTSTGSYTITSSPTGINCNQTNTDDCEEIYDPDTDVTLTATADTGTSFLGWGGPCAGIATTCTVKMNENLTVSPLFTKLTKKLTVDASPGAGIGRVTSPNIPPQVNTTGLSSYDFPFGTVVTLTADPDTGSKFTGWDVPSNPSLCPNDPTIAESCTVTMNNDLTVNARFEKAMLTVILDGSGTGDVTSVPLGIDCPNGLAGGILDNVCDEDFNPGTVVTLTATAGPNSLFTGWSVNSSVNPPCPGTADCRLTMSDLMTVTATFERRQTLDVTILLTDPQGNTPPNVSGKVTFDPPSGPNGDVDELICENNANCPHLVGNYPHDSFVTLTAIAGTDSKFKRWNGNNLGNLCAGTNICSVPMNQARNIVAEFVNVQTLKVATVGPGNVTSDPATDGIDCGTDCEEAYPIIPAPHKIVTLTATPEATFTGWSGSGATACTGNPVCEVTIDNDYELMATFHLQNTLTVVKQGTGRGRVTSVPVGIDCGINCEEAFNEGTVVTLTAVDFNGSRFTGWSEPSCSGNTCDVTMNGNLTVIATFALEKTDNDLVIDLGADGIWAYMNNDPNQWVKIHTLSPEKMAIGDIDGTGQDDLITAFLQGIWALMNNTNWANLHTLQAGSVITTGDLDDSGKDDLLIDFGPGPGLWAMMNNDQANGWVQIHPLSPKGLVAGDFKGDRQDEVVIDFGPSLGIWIFSDFLSNPHVWFPLHKTASADSMVIGDMDSGGNDIIIDFGAPHGIFEWRNNRWWDHIHGYSPDSIVIADLDNDGVGELIIDFGDPYGIWILNNGSGFHSGWYPLHGVSPVSMVVGDLNSDRIDDVIINFGALGIWVVMGDTGFHGNGFIHTWNKLHPGTAELMVTGNLDGIETPPSPALSAAMEDEADKPVPGGVSADDGQPFPE
ncbi:hypothetical protein PN36_02755 [Candidatus Thiomargarita nelsonii]|uniref:Bacterial repeat domain-containing protein n=1 Tax=Candidatus Thiomargarita nelsonii TaxID=1003181 RepID=A0A4E0R752_9GAMM|nr:hypothetical protein PN36_02755 [Candidatus Thiomargarita nelsonii]